MEKIDTHLKQVWVNDKPNTGLPFTSIKQEAEHFIYTNNKLLFDLLQERKDFVCKFARCKRLLDLYGECLQKSLCIFHANSEMTNHKN